jgi:hypothetical protein
MGGRLKGLVAFAHDTLGLVLYPGQAEVLEAWAVSNRRKAVLALADGQGRAQWLP